MPDLVQAAAAILAQAQQRTEIAGRNVANATVPAYKRQIAFAALAAAGAERSDAPPVATTVDFRPGKLVETGNPYDLALGGGGFFAVADEGGVRFTRAGRFTRQGDGRLADVLGGVLQAAGGGDVVVGGEGPFEVRPDGAILLAGSPAGRVAVYDTARRQALVPVAGGFVDREGSQQIAEGARVVQGFYEASNVSTADEMVQMMQALRMAEAGQRVMITYDDLMGRVLSTFGESVR